MLIDLEWVRCVLSLSPRPLEKGIERLTELKITGQGKIGYTTGAQPAPKNSERTGWAINEDNHLQFAGSDLIACPNSIDGAWSIWASAGVANPAGNKDCTGIAARVEETKNPNGCKYTE